MALKPFWNKKYHLGMTGDEVKAGIKAGAAIPKIEDGDVGKAVVVNEAGTGFELAEVGKGGDLYLSAITMKVTTLVTIHFTLLTKNALPLGTMTIDDFSNIMDTLGFSATPMPVNCSDIYSGVGPIQMEFYNVTTLEKGANIIKMNGTYVSIISGSASVSQITNANVSEISIDSSTKL